MIIELRRDDRKAVVDTKGAYLTNYSDDSGDIIYPKRVIANSAGELKTRGGCHVCLPNFGPGGESGLDQHGYGRTSDWGIVESSDAHVVFKLDGQGDYAGMTSFLQYQLSETGLLMTLTLQNQGGTVLEVGPAFHPYFETGDHMVVDGEPFDMGAYNEMVLSDENQEKIINTNHRTIVLKSPEMPFWAQWSDRLADYFCIEPNFGGFTFVPENHRRVDALQPSETKVYTFSIA
jgi:D-hexose-6-phosphate mutarotase